MKAKIINDNTFAERGKKMNNIYTSFHIPVRSDC